MKKNKHFIYISALLLVVALIGIISIILKNKKYENADLKVPVLMYHHFTENREEATMETVYVEEFKKQMKYLADNDYTPIDSDDLIKILNGDKKAPKKPVFITSDDGYLSNYEYMYPILKENKLKATIFLIGQRVDTADTSTLGFPKLNWSEAKEMYESGVIDFQSHTYDSHDKAKTRTWEKGEFSSPTIDESDEEYRIRIDKDIKLSIEGFEKNLGYAPIAFTYPFGEYSEISEEVLKDNNMKLTFTVDKGLVTKEDNGYLLKRINIKRDDSIETFIEKLELQNYNQ